MVLYDESAENIKKKPGRQHNSSWSAEPPPSPSTAWRIPISTRASIIYDSWNRLIRRVKPDGTVIDLGYDHAGNGVFKTVATATNATFTAYLVDKNSLTGYAQVLEELHEDGLGGLKLFRTYAIGHDVISQTTRDSSLILHTSYFLYDGQGSVWGLADESGTVTDYYAYDAFGLLILQSVFDPSAMALVAVSTANGSLVTANNILYTGEMWDADLQQYYLRARYYEPSRGRFWTQDSFEGFNVDPISLHKYLYANANPVMYTDPSGRYSLGELATASAISGTINGFSSKLYGGSFVKGFCIGAAGGAAGYGAGSLLVSAGYSTATVAGGMLVGMASGLSSGAFEQVWNYFDFDPKTRFSPSDLFLNILFSTVAGGVTGKIAQGTAITMVEEFDKAIENMYSIIIAVDATTWGNNFINLMKDCRWLIRESSVPPIQE